MSDIEPEWAPLEKVALLARHHPDLPAFHEREFMSMSSQPESGPHRMPAYKHRDTRAYLHLDDDALPHGGPGFEALAETVAARGLDEFDAMPALHRTTPPDRWPADDVDAIAALQEPW